MPDAVYKVMLSSTFRDLRDEREAATAATAAILGQPGGSCSATIRSGQD